MQKDGKPGENMFLGSGWTLVSPGKLRFKARLREVLHTGKGKRVAIFYVEKRKSPKP